MILKAVIQINTAPSIALTLLKQILLHLVLIIPQASLLGEAKWLLETHAILFKAQTTLNAGQASHAKLHPIQMSLSVWVSLKMPLVLTTNLAILAFSVKTKQIHLLVSLCLLWEGNATLLRCAGLEHGAITIPALLLDPLRLVLQSLLPHSRFKTSMISI